MFEDSQAFSSYSVNDTAAARQFYSETLGLDVSEDWMGLKFSFPNGHTVFLYQKDDHQPANFTVLNLPVEDIDATIDKLEALGITMERYGSLPPPAQQDDRGVLRGKAVEMGPDIAWFKDPAGNVIAILED